MMPVIYILGISAVGAYIFQGILGFIQIKHFTKIYGEMRKRGRVAIGRKAGKFRAGTIVMFTIDEAGIILASYKIQGTTILARFKPLAGFEGVNILSLEKKLPCVRKENKLTQATIMDAVTIYKRVLNGEIIKAKETPFASLATRLALIKYSIQLKLRKGVEK
ncbi:transcriptional regulator GutM [Carnobacterium maltaromaticum]|uniref:transcriptional regulator GutM n=1 Tax=Carnobacterium maltaromaticum TaxID=2751 RepID=UPI0039BDEBE7